MVRFYITKLPIYEITKSFYAAGLVVRRLASTKAMPNMKSANRTSVKIEAVSEKSNEKELGASGYIRVRKASTP